MITAYLNFAMMSSRFESRILLLSLFILSLSLLSFKPLVAFTVLILSISLNFRVFKSFARFLPFILVYVVVSSIFGGISKLPTFLAMISLYLFLHDFDVEEISSALMFFKFPPKFSYSIAISVRMLQNFLNDLKYLTELKRFEEFGYFELLKRLTNLAVVKAIAMAESLKSRGFDLDKRILILRKPSLKDWFLLTVSIAILLLSILI